MVNYFRASSSDHAIPYKRQSTRPFPSKEKKRSSIYASRWEKGIPATQYKAAELPKEIEESIYHIYTEM
jgi:hypothetical protein